MKKLYILGMMLGVCAVFSSCNDEWKDELYVEMVSLKAPLGSQGVHDIYVRYQSDGSGSFLLPVIVSGSRENARNIDVKISVDNDTLDFVKECVDKNVTDIDVSYYEDDLNTITKDVQSKLLDEVNRKSLIAVIAYAYMQDENYEEWFENYFKRVDTYDADQKKNYLNMRNDLISFNKGAVA